LIYIKIYYIVRKVQSRGILKMVHPLAKVVVPLFIGIGFSIGLYVAQTQSGPATKSPVLVPSLASPSPSTIVETDQAKPTNTLKPNTGEDYQSRSKPTIEDKIKEEQSAPSPGELAPVPPEPEPRKPPKPRPIKTQKPTPTPSASPTPVPTPTDSVQGNPNLPPVKISPPEPTPSTTPSVEATQEPKVVNPTPLESPKP
jgi:hypothetical protein